MLRATGRRVIEGVPALLARIGVVERAKGTAAMDLAAPVMVTGALRIMLRVADFAMIGIALGDAAIAGFELGFQYYFIGFGLSLAVSSGTISVVSRLRGAGEEARANLAVKQSLWLALAISLPLTVVAWAFGDVLVGLLSADPDVVRHGSTYLAIVMIGMAPRFWSMVAARSLAGAADTRTPMYVRLLTLPTNIGLNAVLIFGLGPFPRLGVAGAALGTVLANSLAAAVFLALMLAGNRVVALPIGGRQFDLDLTAEIVRVATPLAGMRLLQTGARFPFLFVLGVLGTPILAAYAIGRRVVLFALMPAWGFSTASSTLVGQALGGGDEEEADSYGWQTLRIALAIQLAIAVVVVVLARPIALLFGTDNPALAAEFVRVFGLVVAGFSVSRTMRGALRGAGDTRFPLYGTALGAYVVRLPIAVLALPTAWAVSLPLLGSISPGLGLGLAAIYLAIVLDFYARAAVNVGRFHSGRWRAVARASRVGATGEEMD